MKRCERCDKPEPAGSSASFELFDYCAECGKNLCDACMEKGCCGHVPALSGTKADFGDEDEEGDS